MKASSNMVGLMELAIFVHMKMVVVYNSIKCSIEGSLKIIKNMARAYKNQLLTTLKESSNMMKK